MQSYDQNMKASYDNGRQQHARGSFADLTVPAKGRSPGEFEFEIALDQIGGPHAGILTIGEDEAVMAVVPLDPNAKTTTLEPQPSGRRCRSGRSARAERLAVRHCRTDPLRFADRFATLDIDVCGC